MHLRRPRFRALSLACAGASASFAVHAQDPELLLAPVVISGPAPSALPSYQVERIRVGPLGEKALLDTPYSISVVPTALATNQQLESVREAFRFIASVQGENIRPQTRGLQAGVVQNTRVDGLNVAATTDYPIEEFERIEVLGGLSGALYGPANPAGTFNFVFKRPTDAPLRQFTIGYASRQSLLEHLDLGGHFGKDDSFGYRLNLLNQNGESYAPGSRLRRELASLAFDVRFNRDTRLETNFSTYHYLDTGFPGTFALARGVPFPGALDPTRQGYGQTWAGDDNVTNIYSATLKHDFGEDWHLTAGLLRETSDRASTVPTLTLANAAGAYTATTATTTFSLDSIVSNNLALNGRTWLAGMSHDLVIANTGFFWNRYTPFQTGAITLGRGNLADPASFAEPPLPDFSNRFRAVRTIQQSLTLGDTIGFNSQWSALLAASQSWISVRNFNRSGSTTSRYDASGISPTASLIYKPRPNMTAYLTYADSLQQGDSAPSGSANAGESLAPYRSREWELGYKLEIDTMNLGLALYRIQRPYAYVGANNVFANGGEQVNRGLELSANGAVSRDLHVYAGLSLLDPRLFDTGSAATSDKQILGLSKLVFNALFDYSVPRVPGLAFNLNVNHASRRPGNYSDMDFVDGYTVLDLGARYQTRIAGRKVVLRLAVDNLTNRQYWANIAPTGQNGFNSTDNGTGTLGAPRTVRASIQVDL
ncbi:TonB-dependent siderophore receptor [Burkholderia gladioli]|uniref:TonB-dependent receptor n=1 Tax=Burkholderia gladioli TaxID=28095 RepID=UPI001560753E|nr:TonB-dependent siderophore receptor [Burkholderia gladioli]NRF86388.1 TonB-dependent siderophore receptor [Burkholderia gladioli]